MQMFLNLSIHFIKWSPLLLKSLKRMLFANFLHSCNNRLQFSALQIFLKWSFNNWMLCLLQQDFEMCWALRGLRLRYESEWLDHLAGQGGGRKLVNCVTFLTQHLLSTPDPWVSESDGGAGEGLLEFIQRSVETLLVGCGSSFPHVGAFGRWIWVSFRPERGNLRKQLQELHMRSPCWGAHSGPIQLTPEISTVDSSEYHCFRGWGGGGMVALWPLYFQIVLVRECVSAPRGLEFGHR